MLPACRYLTPASAVYRLLTAPARIGRFFDASGNAVSCSTPCSITRITSANTRKQQTALHSLVKHVQSSIPSWVLPTSCSRGHTVPYNVWHTCTPLHFKHSNAVVGDEPFEFKFSNFKLQVYAPEHERILGKGAKATARQQALARARTSSLGMAYSLSLALSFVAMVAMEGHASAFTGH